MPHVRTEPRAIKRAPRQSAAVERLIRATEIERERRGAQFKRSARHHQEAPDLSTLPERAPVLAGTHCFPLSAWDQRLLTRRLRVGLVSMAALGITVAGLSMLAAITVAPLAWHALQSAIAPPPPLSVAGAGLPTTFLAPTLPPSDSVMAIGATESIDGIAITVSDLRLATAIGAVGAPSGMAFAVVRVRLVDLDAVRAMSYNAGDFALVSGDGHVFHEVFAALGDPLGVGQLAPSASASGEIAFLVTPQTDPSAVDPQIVFWPSLSSGNLVSWSMPLAPVMP